MSGRTTSSLTAPMTERLSGCCASSTSLSAMVHRSDLHTTLADAVMRLDPNAIRHGAEVVGFDNRDDGVMVSLSSGDTVSGDILMGADGIHSSVRAAVFGAGPATFTGCMAWRGVIPSERVFSHMAWLN